MRIADADRVRLGAYLAAGTTVMHEGFCNFNAGTMGASMVEGRISAGVVVGDGSDIGGGASIMEPCPIWLQVISVGEGAWWAPTRGIGICSATAASWRLAASITAGSKITPPDGAVVKGRTSPVPKTCCSGGIR